MTRIFEIYSGTLQEGKMWKLTSISPLSPPEGREREFATYGHSFLVLAVHQAIHVERAFDLGPSIMTEMIRHLETSLA